MQTSLGNSRRKPVEIEMSGRNKAFAKVGEKVVGAATAWTDSRGKFVIMSAVVREPYRRRGIASQMYSSIEASSGKQLTPAVSLSDDAFEFWKHYRPQAVAQDLRHWNEQLVGERVTKDGLPGKILSVSGGTATMAFDQPQPNGTQATILRGNLNQALAAAGRPAINFDSEHIPPIQDVMRSSTRDLGLAITKVYKGVLLWKVLLDESSAKSGPFDGGCLICAQAIINANGRGELVRIVNGDVSPPTTDHYGASIDGFIHDFSGHYKTPSDWIKKFEALEGLRDRQRFMEFGQDPASNIPQDARASDKIAQLIETAHRVIKKLSTEQLSIDHQTPESSATRPSARTKLTP